MKTPVKVTLWIVGGLVLLVVAAATFIALTFDPNKYKAELAAAVQQATGRELVIDGDIGLSFFPWLGVEVGAMRLGNAPGFGDEPFARIEHAALRVKLLPLLRKEVDVDTVTLSGLRLELRRDAAGRTNWEDLTGAEQADATPAEAAGPTLAGFALGGVELRDATIVWDDATKPARYELSKLELQSGPVNLRDPVTLELAFDFTSSAPAASGRMQLSTRALYDAEHQRLTLDELALDSRISGFGLRDSDIKVRTQALLDLAADHYQARGLTLDATLRGDAVPGGQIDAQVATELDLALAEDRLALTPLRITVAGVAAEGALHGTLAEPRYTGNLNVAAFSPRELMQRLGIAVPLTADPQALTQASARIAFEASTDAATLGDIDVRLDQTRLTGTAAITDFAKRALRFQLALDALDADRYLPPPAPADAPPVAPPAAAAAAAADTAPPSALRTLDLDGRLTLGRLKIAKLTLNELRVNATAKDGLIRLQPISAALYDGRYRGDLRIDARGERLRIATDDRLTQIAVGPLVQALFDKDLAAGTGELTLQLAGTGPGAAEFRRSVDGKIGFSFVNGRINGVNLVQMIRQDYLKYLQALGADEQRLNQTVFSRFAATATVKDGELVTDDLVLNSAQLAVKGRGRINLATEEIALQLDATPAGQLARQLGDFKDVVVPIFVGGTFAAPTFKVALDDALGRKAKAMLDAERRRLEQKAQQRLDEERTKLEQQLERKSQEAEQRLQQEQQKLEDKVQQQLQNKLKELFQ